MFTVLFLDQKGMSSAKPTAATLAGRSRACGVGADDRLQAQGGIVDSVVDGDHGAVSTVVLVGKSRMICCADTGRRQRHGRRACTSNWW